MNAIPHINLALEDQPAMKLNVSARLVAAICQFKAHDDIRYYLNGVYVEPIESGGVVIVGTNGYAMGIWRDTKGTIDRPAILRIGKRLEAACTGSDLKRLTIIDDRLAVVMEPAKDTKGTQGPTLEVYVQPKHGTKSGSWEVDGKYPDWKKVIPRESSVCQLQNAIDPEYVALARRAIRLGGGDKYDSVSLLQPDKDGGIAVVSNRNTDFFGIIMPIHDEGRAYPDWVWRLKPKAEARLPSQQPSDAAPVEEGCAA